MEKTLVLFTKKTCCCLTSLSETEMLRGMGTNGATLSGTWTTEGSRWRTGGSLWSMIRRATEHTVDRTGEPLSCTDTMSR